MGTLVLPNVYIYLFVNKCLFVYENLGLNSWRLDIILLPCHLCHVVKSLQVFSGGLSTPMKSLQNYMVATLWVFEAKQSKTKTNTIWITGFFGFLLAEFCNRTLWLLVYQRHIKFTSIYKEIVLKFRNVQDFWNFNWTMSWNFSK